MARLAKLEYERQAGKLLQADTVQNVQRLTGHADPRTTRLYDRRQKKITRNVVERIPI